MEIEAEDGTKIQLKKRSITEFGRGLGFQIDDRTVSRRQISLKISNSDQKNGKQDGESRVSFQVLGKNPIWVLSNDTKEIRVFRNSEKGELKVGDGFCVSCKNPIFFTLRKIGGFDGKPEEKEGNRDFKEMDRTERISVDTEMAESTPSEGEVGFDASEIDPVKAKPKCCAVFGFLKMGHEFDKYPKHRIRGIKDLDWFLEEQKQDSEDDEGNRSRKRKGLGRKKKHNVMEDDDWTGESEVEKVSISKLRMDKRPKYTKTRSKDKNGKTVDVSSGKSSSQKNTIHANEEDEDEDDETLDEDEDDETLDEDEDDETLGGFIVDDEGLDEEEEEEEEEENDEDIIDEDEEEDDDDE